MDWREMFTKSRMYPLALILLVYIGYWWRNDTHKKELKEAQEKYQAEQKCNKKGLIILQGETMGTYYDIRYYAADSVNYQHEIDSIFRDFSQSLSTYIPLSDISLFNQHDTLIGFSAYFLPVLNQSRIIFEKTEGAFDPTIMPLVNEWGFGFDKRKENLPSPEKIDSLKKFVNFKYIIQKDSLLTKTKKGVMLDFSAVAKGYGVDVIADFLKNKGIKNLKVEIG